MSKEIFNVLNDLVKIQSVSSNLTELNKIVDYVEKYFLENDNKVVKRFEYNNKPSILIQNFSGNDADITLCGHLDVVPSSQENQFNPVIKDGKIYARGAGDMKSGDALMMVLFKEILDKKYTDKKIGLLLTTDEEVGGNDGVKMILENGYSSKVVLIPDSGSLDNIVLAEKGIIRLDIEISGKSCHASRPWLGDNPIDKTFKIYSELKETIQDDEKLNSKDHWGSSVNLTVINSGTASNVIPDNLKASFDIRYTEKFANNKKLFEDIEKIIYKYDGKIISYIVGNLLYTDPSNSLVEKYISISKNIVGEKLKISKEHGASDGRFFASKNIPVILHRPTCENIHADDEFVYEQDIYEIYNMYKKFLFE